MLGGRVARTLSLHYCLSLPLEQAKLKSDTLLFNLTLFHSLAHEIF